jgi:hypothetical protein
MCIILGVVTTLASLTGSAARLPDTAYVWRLAEVSTPFQKQKVNYETQNE